MCNSECILHSMKELKILHQHLTITRTRAIENSKYLSHFYKTFSFKNKFHFDTSAHSAIFSMKLEYRPVWSQTTSRRKCTDIYNFSIALPTFEICFNNINDKNTCYLPTGTYLETINTSNRQTQPERAVFFPFLTKSNVRDVTRSTNPCKRSLPPPPLRLG